MLSVALQLTRSTVLHRKDNCDLVVRALSQRARKGIVQLGSLRFSCALGRSGLGYRKREGDGLTPIGRWPIRQVYFRPDRRCPISRPSILPRIPKRPIRTDDGWCDAPGDANYNRAVVHPYPASAEKMWREDNLYDVVVVLGHNDRPRVQGGGSAIFMHVADEADNGELRPTAGCIALRARDLRTVLSLVSASTHLRIVG